MRALEFLRSGQIANNSICCSRTCVDLRKKMSEWLCHKTAINKQISRLLFPRSLSSSSPRNKMLCKCACKKVACAFTYLAARRCIAPWPYIYTIYKYRNRILNTHCKHTHRELRTEHKDFSIFNLLLAFSKQGKRESFCYDTMAREWHHLHKTTFAFHLYEICRNRFFAFSFRQQSELFLGKK